MTRRGGLQSTEFWLCVAVVTCATALLLADHVGEHTWRWVVTGVGGAYVIGRSVVKAAGSRGTSNVTVVQDVQVPPADPVEPVVEEPKTAAEGMDRIRQALEKNAQALSALSGDLS